MKHKLHPSQIKEANQPTKDLAEIFDRNKSKKGRAKYIKEAQDKIKYIKEEYGI